MSFELILDCFWYYGVDVVVRFVVNVVVNVVVHVQMEACKYVPICVYGIWQNVGWAARRLGAAVRQLYSGSGGGSGTDHIRSHRTLILNIRQIVSDPSSQIINMQQTIPFSQSQDQNSQANEMQC